MGCSAPSPMPSHSGRRVAATGGVGGEYGSLNMPLLGEGWPTGRGVRPLRGVSHDPLHSGRGVAKGWLDRVGNWAPSPMPSHSGREVAKGWGIWHPYPCPLIVGEGWPKDGEYSFKEGWPTGRGVRFRLVGDYRLPRQASPATPSEKGNSAPSPVPSPTGRGVADRRMGWTTPSGYACHPFGEGEYSRGGQRTGCSAPSPVPSPTGRGVANDGGVHSRPLLGWVADYPVRLCLPPLRRRGIWHPYLLPVGEVWPRDGVFDALTRTLSQWERGVLWVTAPCSTSPKGWRANARLGSGLIRLPSGERQ